MVANIVLIGFIILFAFVFYLTWKKFFQLIKSNVDDIKNINLELSTFNVNNAVREYQNIGRIFRNYSISKSIWDSYANSLIKIQDNDTGEHKIWATLDANNYFNLAGICENMSLGFWQNLGGTFTGIGILGTFLGLSIGVYYINVDDVELMKIGIGNLLSGLSTAFITSLIGIILALIYAVYYKQQTEKLEKEIAITAEKLDELFPKKIAEQIFIETYQKVEEQTIQFNDFSSQLAISIGDALANQLEESSLAQDMSDIKQSMQNINDFMRDDLGNIIGKAIADNFTSQIEPTFKALNESIAKLGSTGLDALKDTITEGTGAQMDAFSSSLSNISNAMQEASSQMMETSSRVNNDITNTLMALLQQTNENREAMAKSGNEISAVINESFKNTSNQINDMLASAISTAMEKMNNNIKVIMDETEASQLKTKETADTLNKGMQDSVNNVVGKLDGIFTAMTENTKLQQAKIEATNQHINENIQQSMLNMKTQVENMIQAHSMSMQDTQNSIIKFINNAKDGLEENQKALEKLSSNVAELIDKAQNTANTFYDAAEPIKGIADSLQEHTDKMIAIDKEYNDKIQKGINDLKSAVESNSDGYSYLQKRLEEVLEHWARYNEQYASEKEAIASIFDNINKNLKDYNQEINESYKKSLEQYDKSFKTAYSTLGSIIDDLKEAIDDFSEAR